MFGIGLTELLILVFLGVPYFTPAIIAFRRRHPDRLPVLLVTMFAGWTVIGWIAALIWALKDEPPRGGDS